MADDTPVQNTDPLLQTLMSLQPQPQADTQSIPVQGQLQPPPTATPEQLGGLTPQAYQAGKEALGQTPPKATAGYGMPGIISLIGQFIKPHSDNPMLRTPSRMDAFESFLGNFANSLTQGLAASGTGPGANIRGAAAAMGAPHQAAVQQYQQYQQQQEQQARIAQQQAETARQQQETEAAAKMAPLQQQTAQANLQLLQRRLGFTDPEMFTQTIASLTPEHLNADETVQWNNALREATIKGDFQPLVSAANAIVKNRAINNRTGQVAWEPDSGSSTQFSRVQYDKVGNRISVEKNLQPPFALPKVTQTQELRQDASGQWVAIPVTKTTSPVASGKGAGSAVGAAKPVTGAGGAALGGKPPEAVVKAYEGYQDSLSRYNVMQENVESAMKGDQQAMLSLLANHLGMTMGLAKGARINQAIISEAERSRPWLQGMQSKFDKDGYLSGVTLTPTQMQQMVALGKDRLNQDLRKYQAMQGFFQGQTGVSAGGGGSAAAGGEGRRVVDLTK